MHPLKLGIDALQSVHLTLLNAIHQGVNLALWGNQSGDIDPLASPYLGIRAQTGTNGLIIRKVDALQTLDDRVAQEFMNSCAVEADTLVE